MAAPVGRVGSAPVGGAALTLVPGDEHGRPAALVGGAVEDRWQVLGQPLVAVGDRAVVHVVDQVRRDEGERGQRVVLQVGGQLGVGHVMGGAPAARGVVRGRVVPHRVLASVRLVTVRGHRFFVSLPRLALSEDAPRLRRTAGDGVAVAVELGDGLIPEPGGRADVVRQAGVTDVVVIGGQPTLLGQRVDVRGLGRADDRVVAVVFHPHPDHVLIGRRRSGRAARAAGGGRRHHGCGARDDSGGDGAAEQQRDGRQEGNHSGSHGTSRQ